MRHMIRTSLAVVALILATAAPAQATTTKVPFTGTSSLIDVPSFGVEKDVGATVHVSDMVLVYAQATGNPMLDGNTTVTLSFTFSPANGGVWSGTERWAPTAYLGEGFTCTATGGWDADGQVFGSHRCQGFGEHLAGWQFRGTIEHETLISGYLFKPGD